MEHRLLEGAASVVIYIIFVVKEKAKVLPFRGNPSEQAHMGNELGTWES